MITSDEAKATGSCPTGSNNVEMIPRAGTKKKENTCYTCPSNCKWGGGCNDATTNQGVGPPNTPACKVGDSIYCMNCPFSSDNAKDYAQCSNGVQYNDGVCNGWSGCAGSSLQGYASDGKTKKDWHWSADEIDRLTHSACLGSTEMGLNRPLPDGYSYDATGTCAVIPPRGRGTGKQTLKCPSGGTIDTVLFASYGLPRGSCKDISGGDFKIDPKCHDPNSQKIVEGQCLGKKSCTIDANKAYTDTCDKKDGSIFDGGFPRRLAVVVNCKNPTPPPPPKPPTPPPSPSKGFGESGPSAPPPSKGFGESGPAAPPPPSVLYSCNNYVCSKDPNGKYTTLEDCNDACKTKYTCDKNNWEIKKDMNGEYSTLHEAYLNCKKPPPRYSCDKNTWQIKKDQNGEYATAEEAALNCKNPLIIPKQNVTQEMVDNENKITSNINGKIEYQKNDLKSSYSNMIVWGAVSILVIFMLFYYTTNRTDGILKTLITILICLVIIWIVASWFYNYFYKNSISFISTPQIF
tara:strand:- start:1843 stop:3396 length:1554 start_codon:yes stop_codon:yes gene_type:complete